MDQHIRPIRLSHLVAVVTLAGLVRAAVALRTAVPARDAEAYLWMADQIADGGWGAAFATVFHPLYSVLIAALLWVAPDAVSTVCAGQLVSCACATLATWPLVTAARRLTGSEFAALACGVFYAVGIWFVRHPADCLSEGPFFLCVALFARVLADSPVATPARLRHGVLLGVLAGIAFGLRPEGAALGLLAAPWFAMRRAFAAAAGVALGGLALAAPFVIGWSAHHDALTLTPKLAFNLAQGVAHPDHEPVAHYFGNLLRMGTTAFEAIGFAALPLAIVGVARLRPALRAPHTVLLGAFVLQCLVAPALRNNIRFYAGFGILVLPYAGLGAAWLFDRLGARPRWVQVAVGVLLIGGDLARIPAARRADRVVLIEVGEFVRPRLEPGDRLVTEMPRLAYFAGQPPPPPRPISRADLLGWATEPGARVACVLPARSDVTAADFAALGFVPVALPAPLAALAADRGMLVLERPR